MLSPGYENGDSGRFDKSKPTAKSLSEIKFAVFSPLQFLERLKTLEVELDRPLTQNDIDKYCQQSVFIFESSPEFFDPETKPGKLDFNEKGFYPQIWKDASYDRIKEIRGFIFNALNQAKLEGRLLWEDSEDRRKHTVDEVRSLIALNGMDLSGIDDQTGDFSATRLNQFYKQKNDFPFQIVI